MSKYAIMIPCSANYLPGLNALLNGLDLYENTADVWVIEENIPEAYKKEAKKAFNFKLEFTPIVDLLEGEISLNKQIPSSFYRWVFSPYVLYLKFKDKYDVVSFIGADMVVVNNIMKWFEIADKTGLIVTADNSYSMTQMNEIPKESVGMNGLLSVDPISDAPAFMNPRIHEDVIRKTLEFGNLTNANMSAFSSAIHALNKNDRVLALNSELWTCGVYYLFQMYRSKGLKNRYAYFANRERVHSIHKKWWIDSIIYQALYDKIPGTWLHDNTMLNTQILSGIYRTFNTQYKVKYDYPKNEVFDKLKSGELLYKYQKVAKNNKK